MSREFFFRFHFYPNMNYSRRGESNEKAAQRENALFIGFKGDLHELEGEKNQPQAEGEKTMD